jgi:hypothetical protein
MNEFTIRSPRRALIDTAGKWRQLVHPERWGRGKPLTELAQRWTTSSVPEIDALLANHPSTRGFVAEEGEAGRDDVDLYVRGGGTMLGVVGIADLPLGPTVAEELLRSAAKDRLRGGKPPVENMARNVFLVEASVLGELRYRLLAANAALLEEAAARGCTQAVLVFHELRSPTTPRQIAADQIGALGDYLRKLSHRDASHEVGRLAGPLHNAKNLALFAGRALTTSS